MRPVKDASARRDGSLWDGLALAGLAIATLLFAQRPSFGGALSEEIRPQASVTSATQMDAAAEPFPASIVLNAGGAQLRVRPLSPAESSRMRAQGLPGGGLQVLDAAGGSAVALTAGDVIVGLCGRTEAADAARLIAVLKKSRPACVLAATRGSVTERHLGD